MKFRRVNSGSRREAERPKKYHGMLRSRNVNELHGDEEETAILKSMKISAICAAMSIKYVILLEMACGKYMLLIIVDKALKSALMTHRIRLVNENV